MNFDVPHGLLPFISRYSLTVVKGNVTELVRRFVGIMDEGVIICFYNLISQKGPKIKYLYIKFGKTGFLCPVEVKEKCPFLQLRPRKSLLTVYVIFL